jgi:hypothetical protein
MFKKLIQDKPFCYLAILAVISRIFGSSSSQGASNPAGLRKSFHREVLTHGEESTVAVERSRGLSLDFVLH